MDLPAWATDQAALSLKRGQLGANGGLGQKKGATGARCRAERHTCRQSMAAPGRKTVHMGAVRGPLLAGSIAIMILVIVIIVVILPPK